MPKNTPTEHWHLENSYAKLPARLFRLQKPVPVAQPQLVCFNNRLANNLGLGFLNQDHDTLAKFFSGNALPEGAEPIAQAYAGHQFGHFTMLGDGRAVLLGEQITPAGTRFDIQLKGSGQTPYSRRGDGRATLYSMLREYLISEAMHHLGIPTTRSLAVVATGEQVFRGEMNDGAVLTRVAESHIRVGTFEYARNFGSPEDLEALCSYTINRHYPELIDSDNPPLELLKTVMQKQIDLIIHWMRVGFIHGVMNTDNMSIAGETIDYGPCAFMNAYDQGTVFSSIDAHGRYAFGNQPTIARWNLSVFASALLPLISENEQKAIDLVREVLEEFQPTYTEKWYAMMFGKLGIRNPVESDKTLVDRLLTLMETNRADYTHTFLALQLEEAPDNALFNSEDFRNWQKDWEQTHQRDEQETPDFEQMKTHNPTIIPRNHWVENALNSAVEGDYKPFTQLLDMFSKPYSNHPDELKFQPVPVAYDEQYQTFCGT